MATKIILQPKDIDRFWSHVNKTKPDECWNWKLSVIRSGYGRFKLNGKMVSAHRASMTIHAGPIPDEMCVLHHCDNPPCVNPNHLWIGTFADNAADRDKKNRGRAPDRVLNQNGEENHHSTFTEKDVIKIRYGYAGISNTDVAKIYGVTQTAISYVRRRVTWKHIR